jgi:hypothetical protein
MKFTAEQLNLFEIEAEDSLAAYGKLEVDDS